MQERHLTKSELETMKILWRIEKGFLNDIIQNIPEPRPAYTTVSTMMHILVEKEFASYEVYGKSFRYFPLVSQDEYANFFLKDAKKTFFNNSAMSLISFFVKKEEISDEEKEELIAIINKK